MDASVLPKLTSDVLTASICSSATATLMLIWTPNCRGPKTCTSASWTGPAGAATNTTFLSLENICIHSDHSGRDAGVQNRPADHHTRLQVRAGRDVHGQLVVERVCAAVARPDDHGRAVRGSLKFHSKPLGRSGSALPRLEYLRAARRQRRTKRASKAQCAVLSRWDKNPS